ncbi:hypothetical protein LshimejAT787_0702410 [Lyophyllum shimeji]|uniref:Uncharacterized protein n=1 Tax=Lyophyllum shimeji TaxID=47721 RepID=A0A9P3UQZ3_LYOSH|nr:hypothetical protein LshimejAT787_0702410 [Lyophyllum shimeji]
MTLSQFEFPSTSSMTLSPSCASASLPFRRRDTMVGIRFSRTRLVHAHHHEEMEMTQIHTQHTKNDTHVKSCEDAYDKNAQTGQR